MTASQSVSTLRLLVKPTLFTAGVCGTCFCTAAIVQNERNRHKYQLVATTRTRQPFIVLQEWNQRQRQQIGGIRETFLDYRRKINSWWNQLRQGQKIACGTIFANLIVLGAWRIPQFGPVMSRFFLSRVNTTKINLSPMILSCFSHIMPMHFAFNMYALYSFSDFANSLLGTEQLVGLFISAGTVSSLTSLAYRLITKRCNPSLGASGAILGVVAYICVVRPDSQLLLFFIPIAAGNAIKGLMMMDTVGLLAKWSLFDHAAHLGGSLFGVWYALRGEQLYYKHRKTVVENWLKLKSKYD